MASLTPGTLQKLLQNAGNKDFKAAGEHRSPLLQVISIVPSLGDDPWKSRGFYLRVSDSLHSAYVSVSEEDIELILSDNVQLGQFIHVSWLDSGSPVPVLRGIKPIPKRRPCVGEPKDLISCDFLNAKKAVETNKAKSSGKVKKASEKGSNARRLSFSNGKVGGGVEGRRLSLDSSRKGWDSSPVGNKSGGKGASRLKPNDDTLNSDSVVVKRVMVEDSPKSLPLKSKNTIPVTPKLLTKPVRSVKSLDGDNCVLPIHLNKVVLYSERKTSWDALPSTICILGKEVRSYKNLAFASATDALEEASVYEGVVRCLSMFAELCELSTKDSAGLLIEQFLNVHKNIKKTSMLITSLMCARRDGPTRGSNPRIDFTHKNTSASLWVRAAVQTELSKFSLYTNGGEKGHYNVVLDNAPEENRSPKTQKTVNSRKSAVSKVKETGTHQTRHLSSDAGHGTYLPGLGLKQAANLADALLSSSCAWFLEYLESSLTNGFGLSQDDGSGVGTLLGQLKSVNQWLDDACGEGGRVDDARIGRLKKKLYGFLLDHVADTTVASRR